MIFRMAIPSEYLSRVVGREVIRYGCILKDTITGRIVGHLKEVGGWSSLFPSISLDPLATVVQLAKWLDTHTQLKAIKATLDQLGLISSIGTAASLAGLGVSVVGFALVLKNLNEMEGRLVTHLESLKWDVTWLRRRHEAYDTAEVRTACEILESANKNPFDPRSAKRLEQADLLLARQRNSSFELLSNNQIVVNPKSPLSASRSLVARFVAVGCAQLEVRMLLGDFTYWRDLHKQFVSQLQEVQIDPAATLRSRARQTGLPTAKEWEDMTAEITFIGDFLKESLARIDTSVHEVDWLESRGVDLSEYLAFLRTAPNIGVVLVPYEDS